MNKTFVVILLCMSSYSIGMKRLLSYSKSDPEPEFVCYRYPNKLSNDEEKYASTIMSLLAHDGKQLRNILTQNSSGYCSADLAVAEKLFNQCGDEIWNILVSNGSLAHKKTLMLARFIQNRSRHCKAFLKALCGNDFSDAYHYLEINPYVLHTYEAEYE